MADFNPDGRALERRYDGKVGAADVARAAAPGKATRSEPTAGNPTPQQAAVAFANAIEISKRELTALTLALTALDHAGSIAAATSLRTELERAERQLEACNSEDAARLRPDLLAARDRAKPLVLAAPAPSRAAITAGMAGDWTSWDREVQAWRETKPNQHVVHSVGVSPDDVELGHVEVGGVGSPVDVIFFNKSEETVEVHGVSVLAAPAQAPPLPGEFDIKGAAPATLAPRAIARLDLAFRPMVPREIVADLTLTGRAPSGRIERRARLRGTGVNATWRGAEGNELALAQRNSLDASAISEHPGSYAEMLTAVLAAQRLTNEPNRSGEAAATVVLRPVAARLDELMANCDAKLRAFGAGIVAGRSEIGHAQQAVHDWLRRLQGGATIETQALVDEFRYGAETIRLLTGERGDAPSLRKFDQLNTYTLAATLVPIVVPAVAAVIAEAASVVSVEAGQVVGGNLIRWALARPQVAVAVGHFLIGLGMQFGDVPSDWPQVLRSLKDPHALFEFLVQVVADGWGVMEASNSIPRVGMPTVAPEPNEAPPRLGVPAGEEQREEPAPMPAPAPVVAPAAPVAVPDALRGEVIASKVPGATYSEGTFRLQTAHGVTDVTVVRTGDAPRLRFENGAYVIEAPKSLDREALARVVGEQLAEARSELEATASKAATVAPVEAAMREPRARVTTLVAGLFDSIDPTVKNYKGWTFEDEHWRDTLTTEITSPTGKHGNVVRRYDAATKQWTLESAFFRHDMDTWIPSDVPLVPGTGERTGTPLITFVDIRQMKLLGAGYGDIKTVKLSTIQNIATICQIESAMRAGKTIEQVLPTTASVSYAETEIVQSGHTVATMKLTGGHRGPIQFLLDHQEARGIATQEQQDIILGKYSISRSDEVFFNYDITIEITSSLAKGAP